LKAGTIAAELLEQSLCELEKRNKGKRKRKRRKKGNI